MNEVEILIELAKAKQWVPLSAAVVFALLRLMKNDTKFPINIEPRVRVWMALVLGLIAGLLSAVANGLHWQTAVLIGIAASAMAVLGHNVAIDSLRGGKEIVIPGMMIPGASPSPGKPPSIPPPPPLPREEIPTDPEIHVEVPEPPSTKP